METKFYQMIPEPRYIKLYYNNAVLKGLTNNQYSLVIAMLSVSVEKDAQIYAVLDYVTIDQIKKMLNWSDATFKNALRGVKKTFIVKYAGHGKYVFNPDVFGPCGYGDIDNTNDVG